jgi:Tfp pilus assembly protein PilX
MKPANNQAANIRQPGSPYGFLQILGNQEGSFVLFTTLMILLLLTLLGVTMTRNASTEVTIAGNNLAHTISLYQAEGAAVEGAMKIEAAPDSDLKQPTNSNYPTWLTYKDNIAAGALADVANWDFDGGLDDNAAVCDFNPNLQFAAIDKGYATGSSIVMGGGAQKRAYAIYGLNDTMTGQAMVEVGYRRKLN